MEVVQHEIDQLEAKLEAPEVTRLPVDNPGVVALRNDLAALTADLTELRRQGISFVTESNSLLIL
jgi:hypothetical protein